MPNPLPTLAALQRLLKREREAWLAFHRDSDDDSLAAAYDAAALAVGEALMALMRRCGTAPDVEENDA